MRYRACHHRLTGEDRRSLELQIQQLTDDMELSLAGLVEKLRLRGGSRIPPAAAAAAAPCQNAPVVRSALLRLLTSATATELKGRSPADAGSRVVLLLGLLVEAWAPDSGVGVLLRQAVTSAPMNSVVSDPGSLDFNPDPSRVAGRRKVPAYYTLGPLIVACLLPRLVCPAMASDALLKTVWSTLLLEAAVEACDSLLAYASPDLTLRVLTSSLMTSWIRSGSRAYTHEAAAVLHAADAAVSASAGPAVEIPSNEAVSALDRYAECVSKRIYALARSTQAEISVAESREGKECKEGVALLELLRRQLRAPLLSLLDGPVLDVLSMQTGLPDTLQLSNTLWNLHFTLLLLMGLCGFDGDCAASYSEQQPTCCGNDDGRDGECRSGDATAAAAAAAARQERALKLQERRCAHAAYFNVLLQRMSLTYVALSPHSRAHTPGAEAAVMSPKDRAAVREPGTAAARECLSRIRRLADAVWPREQAGEGQQGVAAAGPEQAMAAGQHGPAVEGQAAEPQGQCTCTSAQDDGLDWESVQSELLLAGQQEGSEWGEALWCFNPACTNLEGPSELALMTYACGGGCGLRYCSRECQVEGWKGGHRLSCWQMRGRTAVSVRSATGSAATAEAAPSGV